MAIYTRQTIPEQVRSGIMDPEIKAWLKTGPVLGAHEPIHVQRAAHDALVTCGFDMFRDVAHAYVRKLVAAGNDLTYVHYDDLPHAFIQMTRHSNRCLEATLELAQLLGASLERKAAAQVLA